MLLFCFLPLYSAGRSICVLISFYTAVKLLGMELQDPRHNGESALQGKSSTGKPPHVTSSQILMYSELLNVANQVCVKWNLIGVLICISMIPA